MATSASFSTTSAKHKLMQVAQWCQWGPSNPLANRAPPVKAAQAAQAILKRALSDAMPRWWSWTPSSCPPQKCLRSEGKNWAKKVSNFEPNQEMTLSAQNSLSSMPNSSKAWYTSSCRDCTQSFRWTLQHCMLQINRDLEWSAKKQLIQSIVIVEELFHNQAKKGYGEGNRDHRSIKWKNNL
jgi:hypothetical protein